MDPFPLALPIGSVLAGQYVIERVLGQGGFGITYCAKDHKTGGYVAIKEFFPDSMATRTQTMVVPFTGERGDNYNYGKECFLQEAETLAQFIGNDGIVRIYSYFEENGTAYFVMDYVEGTSFEEYIKQKGGKLSFEETVKILSPVMDALAIVHSRGIIHRDVTPDNIFITKDGTVKLLDFGAARYSLGDRSQSLDVVLKHGFAPKEQYVRRGKQGPYTDVYALAATFYFAMTGKRPPDSIERMDVDELVPPSALGVKIPRDVEHAILMALNVQPADRFQNMQSFKSALGQTSDDVVQPTVQRFFTAPMPSDSQSVSGTERDSENILKSFDTEKSAISSNKAEYVSKANEFFSKLSLILGKNYKTIRILTIIIFAALFIYSVKLFLPDFSECTSLNKVERICCFLSSALVAIALYTNKRKLLIYGIATRICDLVVWLLAVKSDQGTTIYYILLEISLAILLILKILGKNFKSSLLYILAAASLLFIINGNAWVYIDLSAYILLTIVVIHEGGEKNGFN